MRAAGDVTGVRPETCLWYGYDDPEVLEVLRYVRMCSGGMGINPAQLLPLDPPHSVWQGVLHYVQCLALCDADVRKIEEQERENKTKKRR